MRVSADLKSSRDFCKKAAWHVSHSRPGIPPSTVGWEDGATEHRPHGGSISAPFPCSNKRERTWGAQTPSVLERKAVTTGQGGSGVITRRPITGQRREARPGNKPELRPWGEAEQWRQER